MEPRPRSHPVVIVDVRSLVDPDAGTLEVLARMQLVAHRCGASIELHHAGAQLLGLIELAGLADALPVGGRESGVEAERLIEEREEPLVDEVVDPGDATA